MIIDVCVATSVIWWGFDAYMAFLAAIVVVIYLRTASWSVSKKSEHQRRYLKLRKEEHNVLAETSLNWATVSYFSRLKHEWIVMHRRSGQRRNRTLPILCSSFLRMHFVKRFCSWDLPLHAVGPFTRFGSREEKLETLLC